MSDDLFIKIPLKFVRENWVDGRTFSPMERVADLYMMAAFGERKITVENVEYLLEPGELIASFRYLAERWQCNPSTASRFMSKLEKEGMIQKALAVRNTPTQHPNATPPSAWKLSFYGSSESNTLGERNTPTQHPDATNYREGIKREECVSTGSEAQRTSKKFVPPTLEEWIAYGETLDPPFDELPAEAAWNHYEANGWRVGRSKAKDWRACCRLCHTNWRDRTQRTRTRQPDLFDSRPTEPRRSAQKTSQGPAKPLSTWEATRKLEVVKERIQELRNRRYGDHVDLAECLSPDELDEYNRLLGRKKELERTLLET